MKIVTLASAKGGTGKTTSAINLAAALTAAGYRVGLQDLDPQSSATMALGQEPAADPGKADPVELQDGFRLYPCGRTLSQWPADIQAMLDRGRGDLDVLIVDTSPVLTPPVMASLAAADLVLVPVAATALDLQGLTDIAALMHRGGGKLRTVMVRIHARRVLTRDVETQLREHGAAVLYPVQIPEDVRAAEAPGHERPLLAYAPESRAAIAYTELAKVLEADLFSRTLEPDVLANQLRAGARA